MPVVGDVAELVLLAAARVGRTPTRTSRATPAMSRSRRGNAATAPASSFGELFTCAVVVPVALFSTVADPLV